MPVPQTIDEMVGLLAFPLMTLIPQSSLEEIPFPSTTGSSSNGGAMTLESVAISYTFWRNPGEREDPANLADPGDPMREALDASPVRPLPDWMMEQRERMRYPMLWEAVMTTRVSGDNQQTPEPTLIDHVNHILMNSFRDLRMVGGIPGDLDAPVAERHIETATVLVDGTNLPGMRIDTDPHVYAVGVALTDRILTAVVARDYLPHVSLAFTTRAQPSES